MALEPTWNDARKSFLLTQVEGSTEYWTLNDLEYAFAENSVEEDENEAD